MLLLGAVVLVVLVMSVVVFRLLVFSFRWMGLGGGRSACSFVSVSVYCLRLVLVSFLRETVAGFFCSSVWASVPV